MRIRRAAPSEAGELSALAMEAKAHWGYPVADLERWRPELTISSAEIPARPFHVCLIDDEIAGFYSLRRAESTWELDNLWIRPCFMQKGIGRALLEHARRVAAEGGASEITIDSDPNAEAFYLACGAERTGERPAPIGSDAHRVRPQLVLRSR